MPKHWALTVEGEALLAQARRVEDEALAFARVGAGAATLRGTVRLSAPHAFASIFLVPRLGPLRARWPAITLEIIGEIRQADLYRREADLALRMARPDQAGLAARWRRRVTACMRRPPGSSGRRRNGNSSAMAKR